jgi:UTP--glucose-1-phosphate uridylyltransferase
MMITKAVIPAAGFGTRFLPITKVLSKAILPIIDRPSIAWIVDEAIASDISEIYIIINPFEQLIMDYFNQNQSLEKAFLDRNNQESYETLKNIEKDIRIHYIVQAEPLGLGHAVLLAAPYIKNEAFAVMLPDDFYKHEIPALKQLINVYQRTKSNLIGTMKVSTEDVPNYGICIPKIKQLTAYTELANVIEKPIASMVESRQAIVGRYILNSTIFNKLKYQEKGYGNEIQLTDAIKALMQDEKVYAQPLIGKRYDLGKKTDYFEAIVDFGLEHEEIHEFVKTLIKQKANDI